MPHPHHTLLIGYGNSLRGDDAVGRLIAEEVSGWGAKGLRVLSVHQLTPDLAADIAGASHVLFVDASHPALADSEGRILLSALHPDSGSAAHLSSHVLLPAALLAAAETLYDAHPDAALLTVPGAQFEHGAPLSDSARKGMELALEFLRKRFTWSMLE